uniref:Beta-amylase n=1 Tax=Kalanchoe fedtschenkoi TaxID=63787 RepID=A0A7N0UGB0_KALFE
MEVSVIGSSQAQIGRSESGFVKLAMCNPKVHAFPRVSFPPNRRGDFGRVRFSLKAVAESQVAEPNKASADTSPEFSRTNAAVKLFVGLPLDVVSDCHAVNHARAVSVGLKALKLLGVEGVELPVWWGVVEKEAMGKYEWPGYLAVAEMVKKAGLKLHVSLCFHACKEAKIPLPKWVSKIGENHPDVYFTDRSGERYKECLSLAVDDVSVFEGKTGLQVYKEFCESFKVSFEPYLGSTITGITMGLGPNGELRYPSHHHTAPDGSVQGVGEFQCYDRNILSHLKQHAEAAGNPLWGLGGPHDAPSYNQSPNHNPFFKDNGGSWESPYGDFFLSWYSNQLASHGNALLSMASSTFSHKDVTVSGVVPLVHSWFKTRSHPAELTAGFYNTAGRDGYDVVAEIFARNSCKMILPGMDLSDEHQPQGCASSPESLLAQVMSSCLKHKVEISGQNSSISQVPAGFKMIKKNLLDDNAVVDLFTYQRMGALFFSPENFRSFTELVRSLSQPSMDFDDLPSVNAKAAETKQVAAKVEANLQMEAA